MGSNLLRPSALWPPTWNSPPGANPLGHTNNLGSTNWGSTQSEEPILRATLMAPEGGTPLGSLYPAAHTYLPGAHHYYILPSCGPPP